MKKIFIALVTIGILSSSSPVKERETESNSDKWESLFDGETLNGWHRFNRKGVAPVWTAKDGVLTFDPALRPKGDYIHDIVSDKIYKSFQLSIEWNISEGGNSGIFWAVQEGESHNNLIQLVLKFRY